MLRPPPISRPDLEFETKLGVEFVEGREGIVITELNDLFEKVRQGGHGVGGWGGPGAPRAVPFCASWGRPWGARQHDSCGHGTWNPPCPGPVGAPRPSSPYPPPSLLPAGWLPPARPRPAACGAGKHIPRAVGAGHKAVAPGKAGGVGPGQDCAGGSGCGWRSGHGREGSYAGCRLLGCRERVCTGVAAQGPCLRWNAVAGMCRLKQARDPLPRALLGALCPLVQASWSNRRPPSSPVPLPCRAR